MNYKIQEALCLVCVSYSWRIWGLCHCIGIHFLLALEFAAQFYFPRDFPAWVGLNLKTAATLHLGLRHGSQLAESCTCSNQLEVPLTIKALTHVATIVWNGPQHSTTNYYISNNFNTFQYISSFHPRKQASDAFRILQGYPHSMEFFVHVRPSDALKLPSGWPASSDVLEAHEAVDCGSRRSLVSQILNSVVFGVFLLIYFSFACFDLWNPFHTCLVMFIALLFSSFIFCSFLGCIVYLLAGLQPGREVRLGHM